MELRVRELLFALGTTVLMAACGQGSADKKTVSADDSATTERPAPMAAAAGIRLPDSPQHLVLIRPSKQAPGILDSAALDALDEPLRAMAAFYAATGGTDCDGAHCALTTALMLGKQGSEAHKSLIARYFPTDSLAQQVLAQDCYLRPSGASSFSEYASLSFSTQQDTVTVNYRLLLYHRGKADWKNGSDKYIFKAGTFSNINREILNN